jgi:type IV secretory pathway VirB2 component (pilin)
MDNAQQSPRHAQRVAVFALVATLLVVGVLVAPYVAHDVAMAAGAANPWEKPLQDISTSMIGPVVYAAFLIGLIIFCVLWFLGYAAFAAAAGLVIAGAIAANAEGIASWIGLKG